MGSGSLNSFHAAKKTGIFDHIHIFFNISNNFYWRIKSNTSFSSAMKGLHWEKKFVSKGAHNIFNYNFNLHKLA